MKHICSYLAAIGLLSGTMFTHAQSGGAAAGTGTQGGSTQVGGTAPGVGQRGGIASPGLGGVANEQGAIARGTQPVPGTASRGEVPGQPGSAQIGASTPGVGERGGIASPGTGGIANEQGAIATGGQTPGDALAGETQLNQAGQQPVSINALPAQVQTALRTRLGPVAPSAITQQMTASGPVYTVTTTRNGVPVQLQFSSAGTLLPQGAAGTALPSSGVGAAPLGATGAGALGGIEAGLPVTSLPAQVQASIRSQLGNTQIQAISQDQTAAGPVYRVTALRNGVPVELQYSASGALLARNPIQPGTSTSAVVPGVVGTLPGTEVVLDDIPESVREAIQEQVGENMITELRQQNTADGPVYWVGYDQDGRPIRLRVDAEGNIRSNLPADISSVQRERQLTLDELPEAVSTTLETEAPLGDIESIVRDERPTGEVYRISFRTAEDGRYTVLLIDNEGKVIRDSRNVPVIAVGDDTPAPGLDEQPAGQRFERLPRAVQTAIKAYAAEGQIRNIELTTHNNDTVFSVVFFRDARRERMLVTKDGTLISIQEDVPPSVVATKSQPAQIAIGDLPRSVRDTIRRQTDQVMVDKIETALVGDQTVYKVSYRTNNAPVELLVGTDGNVILPVGDIEQSGAAAVATAPPAIREDVPVRRVDVAADMEDEQAGIGAAALRESGAEAAASPGLPQASSVKLDDVPRAVQTTARELAGDGTIKSIVPKLQDGEVVYNITFSQDGRESRIVVDKTGHVDRTPVGED